MLNQEPMVAVSACLAGIACRYNQTAVICDQVQALVGAGRGVLVCPEVLGGLPTPRPPAERQGDRVRTAAGEDVTLGYQRGAMLARQLVKESHCREAVLKAYSPTCGSGWIYDGSFSGRLVAGDGIFAAMLKQDGIKVYTEQEYQSPE